VIETPRYDLTLFKVHFGNLTLKAYTKGEHVLRFETVAHNTKQLRCGRILDRFPEIITRLAGMVDHFATTWTASMSPSSATGSSTNSHYPPRSAPPASAGSM
jgi:hypothetical protein